MRETQQPILLDAQDSFGNPFERLKSDFETRIEINELDTVANISGCLLTYTIIQSFDFDENKPCITFMGRIENVCISHILYPCENKLKEFKCTKLIKIRTSIKGTKFRYLIL